jgi:hypothetical protein
MRWCPMKKFSIKYQVLSHNGLAHKHVVDHIILTLRIRMLQDNGRIEKLRPGIRGSDVGNGTEDREGTQTKHFG